MPLGLLLGIIIILILVFVYISHYMYTNGQLPDGVFKETMESIERQTNKTYDHYFSTPMSLFKNTVGYNDDDTSQTAINKAIKREKMYEYNSRKGKMTDVKGAANNSFVLASLFQHNVANNRKGNPRKKAKARAKKYYNRALARISYNPIATVAPENMRDEAPPPEFIIDRAEDFYEDYINELVLGGTVDLDLQNVYFEQPDFDVIRNQVRNARVITATKKRHDNKKKEKDKKTRQKNMTTEEIKRDNYFEEREITSDPQNVHESQLTDDMARIYSAINKKNNFDNQVMGIPSQHTMGEIQEFLSSHPFENENKRKRALQVFRKMASNSPISKLNDTEDKILLNVWQRIHSPENHQRRTSLKESLADSLADGMDKNHLGEYKEVCAGGRCSRILGSLTLLDEDPAIAAPMKTKEIMRNEIFSKSYKVIQDELGKASDKDRDLYNGVIKENTENANQARKFEKHLKEKIEKFIRTDYHHVDNKYLDELIQDAQAGV
jgi:hypothetical protein